MISQQEAEELKIENLILWMLLYSRPIETIPYKPIDKELEVEIKGEG